MASISVQVPEDHSELLAQLGEKLNIDIHTNVVTRPFDGLAMTQILIPVSAAVVSVLKKWIDARQKSRDAYRIFYQGVDISGYTSAEAERIISKLAGSPPESTDDDRQ
jgi:hypothetical protein